MPSAMIHELRQEERITKGLWGDLHSQHLANCPMDSQAQ